jgi:two-component system sensor histidine kinase KdpD
LSEPNIVMTFLAGVVIVSFRYGRWPSVVASVLSVILFDVIFTTPYFTVVVNDTEYIITFLVMLCVGLVISTLTTRVSRQAETSRQRERRTEALYRLGRKLTGIVGRQFLAIETERIISDTFGGEAAVFLPEQGRLRPIMDHLASFAASETEIAVAQWVFDHGQPAGRGTDTLPSTQAFYLPLVSPEGMMGVLGIKHEGLDQALLSDSRSLLEAFASLLALALERDRLTLQAQDATVQARTQELRSTLLASVSHDIRTPLAVISGACSSLLEENGTPFDNSLRRELLNTISEEADRLTRLVENLLRLTQLSSGRFRITKEWHPVEDIVGSALHRVNRLLGNRTVEVNLPDEMLLGQFDAVLIEQVLVNLLENAARYTPADSPIEITGSRTNTGISLEVADRGPGLSPDELVTVFETFQRGRGAMADSRGAGLGLAICRAIVEAHGGRIEAANRSGGGALFRVDLPWEGKPPQVPVDEKTRELPA